MAVFTGLGSNAAPSFTFSSDTNTGMYSPGANQLALSTDGIAAVTVDSGQRLLVGMSSARDVAQLFNSTKKGGINVEASGDVVNTFTGIINRNDPNGAVIALAHSRGTTGGSNTILQPDDRFGTIAFAGADGTDLNSVGASITAFVDGTPGANDMPGRLVFFTTADGASSPTEQLRITSDRYVRLASGSGGIQFNGDTASANALDDYEEGTWTPVPEALNAPISQPTYTSSGTYVKIGKYVYLSGSINVTVAVNGDGTGGVDQTRIKGLPYYAGASGSTLSATQLFTPGAYSALSASPADSDTPTGAYIYEFYMLTRSLFENTDGGQINHGWRRVGNFSFNCAYRLP